MTPVFPRLAPALQQAIVARLGWTSLRPVQEQAGEALLAGHNAVVLAPTAGGKTEAALFPILSDLLTHPPQGVAALYVAPIKALLNNQAERLGLYTEMVGLTRMVWHGDVGTAARKRFLKEPADLLMTTPESLEVMLISQRVDAEALFADLRIVVIDEIHALAGTDRGAHLMSVLERLARLSRHDVQRVGLPATVGNPEAILSWLQGSSARPGVVVDPPRQPSRRQLLVVHREELDDLVRDAARLARGHKSLFFCQSRAMTETVAEHMRHHGTTVFVHHSAVSREERALAEERFHHGSDACIVATSTLELGIDVGDLDLVLQAEAPDTVGSFLQRMGRTGRRAGLAANTTFFCQGAEGVIQAIALIELARSGWVESIQVNDRCWPTCSRTAPSWRSAAAWSWDLWPSAASAGATSWSCSPSSPAPRATPSRPPQAPPSAPSTRASWTAWWRASPASSSAAGPGSPCASTTSTACSRSSRPPAVANPPGAATCPSSSAASYARPRSTCSPTARTTATCTRAPRPTCTGGWRRPSSRCTCRRRWWGEARVPRAHRMVKQDVSQSFSGSEHE
ncbi:MAG: DEAD/DEAH box helicase [Pseudomonadota bacterium]